MTAIYSACRAPNGPALSTEAIAPPCSPRSRQLQVIGLAVVMLLIPLPLQAQSLRVQAMGLDGPSPGDLWTDLNPLWSSQGQSSR